MRLYQYGDLEVLNLKLEELHQQNIKISKVKIITLGNDVLYYILTDEHNEYQQEAK